MTAAAAACCCYCNHGVDEEEKKHGAKVLTALRLVKPGGYEAPQRFQFIDA